MPDQLESTRCLLLEGENPLMGKSFNIFVLAGNIAKVHNSLAYSPILSRIGLPEERFTKEEEAVLEALSQQCSTSFASSCRACWTR